jgi:molybdopterin synthase catalytic subunit
MTNVGFLTDRPLDLAHLLAEASSPERGGTCAFLGTVRSGAEDGDVVAIEYSAYREMAEAELGRIVAEVEGQWPGVKIAVRHRMGEVPVGEASIAIVAAAPHRAAAFDACRTVIEAVKARLPVWKKEFHVA